MKVAGMFSGVIFYCFCICGATPSVEFTDIRKILRDREDAKEKSFSLNYSHVINHD